MLTVVHAGDLHLGGGNPHEVYGNAYEERFRAFGKILDLCREEEAAILLLPGDVLEQDALTPADLSRVQTMLGSLAKAGIRIFIAPGNHDPATPLSSYRNEWPAGVHVFLEAETVDLPELGATVTGAGFRSMYQRKSLLPEMIRAYEPTQPLALALVHGEMRRGQSELYNSLTTTDLAASPFAYVALSHIHQPDPQVHWAGDTSYAYCGTPQGSSRSDEGERGCFVLRFDETKLVESEFREIADTIWRKKTVELALPEDAEQAFGQIAEQLQAEKQVIWNVTLAGKTAGAYIPDPEALQSRLADAGYLLSGLVDRSSPDIDRHRLALEDSLRGLFYRELAAQSDRTAPEDREVVEEALRLGLDAFRADLV